MPAPRRRPLAPRCLLPAAPPRLVLLLLLLLAPLAALVRRADARALNLLYTADVAGNLFEVDGDARPCVRNVTTGEAVQPATDNALARCAGGAAGRKHFFDEYYADKGGHESVVTLDLGNHFFGSREYFYEKEKGQNKIVEYAKQLRYDAMVVSQKDLNAHPRELRAFGERLHENDVQFVASNLVVDRKPPRAGEQHSDLFELVNDTRKIRPYALIDAGADLRVAVFSLLPQTSVLKSRSMEIAEANDVQVLGQYAEPDEWLMSQTSHLNRLWESALDDPSGPPNYAILVADLPAADVTTLVRVLDFVNLGIGSSAPWKRCNTTHADACAPLHGRPLRVHAEMGVPRENRFEQRRGGKQHGYLFTYQSAPLTLQKFTNESFVATRNGRGVGVFEDCDEAGCTHANGAVGSVFAVNNEHTTPDYQLPGMQASWLQSYNNIVHAEILQLAKNIAQNHRGEDEMGVLYQPVYGDALGSQVYRGNDKRAAGCRQADCPLSRLFLNAMLYAAYDAGLCNSSNADSARSESLRLKQAPLCIALLDGSAMSQSLGSYGTAWRSGTDAADQWTPDGIFDKGEEDRAQADAWDNKRQHTDGLGHESDDMDSSSAWGDEFDDGTYAVVDPAGWDDGDEEDQWWETEDVHSYSDEQGRWGDETGKGVPPETGCTGSECDDEHEGHEGHEGHHAARRRRQRRNLLASRYDESGRRKLAKPGGRGPSGASGSAGGQDPADTNQPAGGPSAGLPDADTPMGSSGATGGAGAGPRSSMMGMKHDHDQLPEELERLEKYRVKESDIRAAYPHSQECEGGACPGDDLHYAGLFVVHVEWLLRLLRLHA